MLTFAVIILDKKITFILLKQMIILPNIEKNTIQERTLKRKKEKNA